MDCQDCGAYPAKKIVFNIAQNEFFAMCDECIGKDDFVCPDELLAGVDK